MRTTTGEDEAQAEGSLEAQVTTTPQARQTGNRLPKPARRRQLLAAAQEVFVAQGYHAAAMDEIAERAGVSKPVLYQHFPGKLDLYLALLDESVAALTATVRAALESTTDNKQRVTATFTAFFDFVGSTGQAFRLVFESDLRNEPAVRARLDESSRDCAEMISEIISEDAGIADERGAPAGHRPGRNGPGQRDLLAGHRPGDPEGCRGATDGQAGLARDQRLAAGQRPCGRRPVKGSPWKSR